MHWLLQSLFLVLLSSIWPQDIDKLFIRFCKNRSMFIYLASWISKKNPSICYLCAISAYDYTVSEEFQCLDLVLVRSIIFKLRDLPLTHLIQRVFFFAHCQTWMKLDRKPTSHEMTSSCLRPFPPLTFDGATDGTVENREVNTDYKISFFKTIVKASENS